MLFFGYYSSHTNPQPDRRDNMIIATFNSAEGHELDNIKFAWSLLDAGTINQKQASRLITTLHGHQPINLHIEKIGRKLWVTLLSKRHTVWTWSIGAGGKDTPPNLDTSEANFRLVEALNTKA
jgi:hypothetical protein